MPIPCGSRYPATVAASISRPMIKIAELISFWPVTMFLPMNLAMGDLAVSLFILISFLKSKRAKRMISSTSCTHYTTKINQSTDSPVIFIENPILVIAEGGK